MISNSLKVIAKVMLALLLPLALIGACNGCRHPLPKAHIADNLPPAEMLIKGRILIDPDFSGAEQELIIQGVKMWTIPLSDVIQIEISKEPVQELRETVTLQHLVIAQERSAAGLVPLKEDEEDTWIDPHDSWDSFDPRTNFWSVDQGCNDKLVILRVTSKMPIIRAMEASSALGGNPVHFIGHTNNSCHRKVILLVVDRIESAKMLSEVMAHELGHALGLKHDFEHNASIMFPDTRAPAACVTRRDIDAFCTRWHCSTTRPRMAGAKSCGEK